MSTKSTKNVPGPGQYEHPNKVGKEGPKYSVGKELRKESQRPQTPGPGHYNNESLVNKNKAPIYSISEIRPKTAILTESKTPGPGSYNSNLKHRPTSPAFK